MQHIQAASKRSGYQAETAASLVVLLDAFFSESLLTVFSTFAALGRSFASERRLDLRYIYIAYCL